MTERFQDHDDLAAELAGYRAEFANQPRPNPLHERRDRTAQAVYRAVWGAPTATDKRLLARIVSCPTHVNPEVFAAARARVLDER